MVSSKAVSRESNKKTQPDIVSQSRKGQSSKRIKSETAEAIETLIVVPPDGGWGWLVVLTSFICNFTADGTMYTFGLFVNDISVSIGCTQTQVALANSLMTGFYYLSGPVISALTNRFGYRVVSILGGLISCASILLTSFSTQLITVLLVYGIGGGVGFGMMYMPSIIVIGFYFERWRAIATSIAVCGSSLGIISFPLIFTNLLENTQWRFKFKILSIACFFCACFSVLYRPLHPVRIVAIDDKKVQFANENESYTSVYLDDEKDVLFSKYHNIGYPTTADIHGRSTVTLAGPRRMSSASIFLNISGPSTSTIKSSIKTKASSTSRSKLSDVQSERLKTVYEEEEYGDNKLKNCCVRCKSRSCCKYSRRTRNIAPARPLYRDDIFYSGSLSILPEYRTSRQSSLIRYPSYEKSAIEYHLSVTRITTQRDIEERYAICVCCPVSMKRTLATMLDLSLLKSPSFLLLSFSGFLTLLGLYTPFLFMPQRAILYGMKPQIAYFLLSTLGIANTIGRIVSGIFSSFPHIKALLVSYVSLIICGCATIASSLSHEIWWQFSFASIYGLSIACVAALRPIILVDMLGLDKLTNGFGLSLLFQGVACLAGIPLSGILKDLMHSYDTPFYFAGVVILLSAIMLIPLDRIMKWEKSINS
ncbi:hypothetical protein ILUMI_10798 [Ignelater luminosus]|uniref:Major facilitator superfamily (MFS) profile domain-containing protein n=1 Tax=Ignelater luminosus TaxID=2038154 RepID=A0A8K0CXF6_IGNLU|nr:hypothetical protein ILUMI_10798 [Ignelater luminosus]